MAETTQTRREMDSLGPLEVPADAWYGVQTARALINFPISGRGPDRDFVVATVRVKLAAARANHDAGCLDEKTFPAIEAACLDLLAGEHADSFVVDRFQAGAGTSHNMNANEVIANLANVRLGGERGQYAPVHPNDHVNYGQSTNDVIPTAIRLTLLTKLPRLLVAVDAMADAFTRLAEQEKDTVKSGRTHLQDAVPTTLGHEFAAYAWTLRRVRDQLLQQKPYLCAIGLGGSAVGTGLNTAPGYAQKVAVHLAELTGEPIVSAENLVAQMQSMADVHMFGSTLRVLAGEVGRISNDMRLLASGPRTGLGEVLLPAVQPGSSIMPGKVNPVMFEMLNQVCYQVLGQDAAASHMAQAGQMELNVMMPALGSALFDGMEWLTAAMQAATERGLHGLKADREQCLKYAEESVGLATLLNRTIGYQKAAEIAKRSQESGRPVREIVVEEALMDGEAFDQMVKEAAALQWQS